MTPCDAVTGSRLAAWVDGEPADSETETEAETGLAQHVAACPRCAAAAAEMRRSKERLRRYRADTTPAALPSHFWTRLRDGLDAQDAQRRHAPKQQGSPGRVFRPRVVLRRPAARLALACAALACAALAAPRLLPPDAVPVSALLRRPAASLPGPRERTLTTGDSDAAARWLSAQLGEDIPAVSLALAEAPLVEAQADPDRHAGVLLFRSADGVPVALHVFVHARLDPRGTARVVYRGGVYRVASDPHLPNSLALWHSRGQVFAAVAPLPPPQLLPYVHQLSRGCLPEH